MFKDWPNRIIDDDTRRLQSNPVRRALEVGLDKFPDQSKRIAALIRDLEVADYGSSPFLGFGFGPTPPDMVIAASPTVKALVHEGGPAVEPLLDCLADDRRLTRAIPFKGINYIVTVADAAYAALRQILQFESFERLTPDRFGPFEIAKSRIDDPRGLAAEIRQFWLKHGRRTGPEIWLSVLADSQATHPQWLEAASAIVAPVPPDIDRFPALGRSPAGEMPEEEAANVNRPMAGEVLRKKRDPSVAELMARRADELDDIVRLGGFFGGFVSEPDLTMTTCLAKWDAKAAVPSIRRRFAEWRTYLGKRGDPAAPWHPSLRDTALALAKLADASARAGDDSVVEDYFAWVREMPEKAFSGFDFPRLLVFLPVWRHQENPKLAELARWAFLAEQSFWRPVYKSNRPWHGDLVPPLLAVPAFRKALKRELANTTIIGTASFDFGDYQMKTNIDGTPGETGASRSSCTVYAPDADVPQSLTIPLRACDECAYEISEFDGAPRIGFYWPDEKREAARAEIAKFVNRWGDAFRDRDVMMDAFDLEFYQAAGFRDWLQLPHLSRPATQEDVAAGRAIFTLGNGSGSQVRLVAMKPYPRIARWKTLEKFRLRQPVPITSPGEDLGQSDERLKALPHESFDREGRIWQAEEILIDGKWRRFYGFVGSHIIAKVPAEEIELLDDFSSAHYTLR